MAQFLVSFAVSYILTRLSQPNGPRLQNLKGFTGDYGGTIPMVFGPGVRSGDGTVIWATDIKETVHKHKPATDYLFGLVGALLPSQKSYTYSIDLAVALCCNEITGISKIWANKKLIYDNGAFSLMASVTVYPGNFTQLPDPTIEADKGMGNVPAYRGIAYVVIDELQLATFGNAVPNQLEFLIQESTSTDLPRVVSVMVAATGVDMNTVSLASAEGVVHGYVVNTATSVADGLQPLAQAYNFDVGDVGGGLRLIPRGRYPRSVVTLDQLAGHDFKEDRPEPIRWTRDPEVSLPQEVTVNFLDIDRDYQPNAAPSRRQGGTAQSNIVIDSNLVLSVTEGQKMADVALWEAWSARGTAEAATDDGRDDLVAGEIHAFEAPTGLDTYRILRRSRGVNGVIKLELAADRPLLYNSTLPGIPAPIAPVDVQLPGPVNPPIFIEPPSSLSGNTPQVWVAVSGGFSGANDPSWPGVVVYVATTDADANYRPAGAVDVPAYQGVLGAPLASYGGANPDTVHTLTVDLVESAGVLESITAGDAAAGVNLAYISDTAPEFLSFQTATATDVHVYDLTNLYRGRFESTAGAHVAGLPFVMLDDTIFRYSLPPEQVGVPLYFRFVQPNQAVADATSYLYTPTGRGFGAGTGGVPLPADGVTVTPGIEQNIVSWTAAPATDNVSTYEVWRAPGLGASFGSAALITSTPALSYTDTSVAADTAYTYFIVPVNVIGAGGSSGSDDGTTSPIKIGPPFATLVASEALSAGNLVNVWNDAGTPKARKANGTAAGKPADGYVLSAVSSGASATVYFEGAITGLSGLTAGPVWLAASGGAVTQTPLAGSGNVVQLVGRAVSATEIDFEAGEAVELT